MKILRYDSPVMVFISKLVDYMLVGVLWMIGCIPVFTYGAATTAALLTVETALHKKEGRIWATFWKWFRKEFKEATLLWLLWLPVQCLVAANIWYLWKGDAASWLRILIGVVTGVIFCWTQLWFGYLSKFENRIKTVLGNTIRMVLANIGSALLILIISAAHIAAAALLLFLMPPLLVLVPGSYLLCYAAVIRKMFLKYLPKAESIEA